MTNNIGDTIYNNCRAQKNAVRARTENSINSLFKRNVITKEQHDKLLHMYLTGEISFGDDGLTPEEAKHFTQETYKTIEETLLKSDKGNSKTLYIIQPGDTPEIIAEKLGYTGNEARQFATKIKAEAIKNGMYHRYGFNTGDMITLSGDFKEKIDALRANGEYTENSRDINEKYINVKTKQTGQTVQKSKQKEISAEDKIKAEKIKTEAERINIGLKYGANSSNLALRYINSENIAFVLKLFKLNTGRSLALDLINNGDKNLKEVKDHICLHLAKRAQELSLEDITPYDDIQKPVEIISWIEDIQAKILNAEKENNPAFAEISAEKQEREQEMNSSKFKPVKELQKNSLKIAQDLHNSIEDDFSVNKILNNRNNEQTIAILKKIKPENAAFLAAEYKKLAGETITNALDNEIGLDIDDVKNYICKNLVSRAKAIGLTGINIRDYSNINDIKTLSAWVEKTAQRIIETEKNNENYQLPENTIKSNTKKEKNQITKTITEHPLFKNSGIKNIQETYTNDNYKIDSTYTFTDGRIVQEKFVASEAQTRKQLKGTVISYDNNGNFHVTNSDGKNLEVKKDTGGSYFEINNKKYYLVKVRKLLAEGVSTQESESQKLYEPVPVSISLPQNSDSNARSFAKALEDNKAELMKVLKIDNDTYNKLARLAMAIAEQETNFGAPQGGRKVKYNALELFTDTLAGDYIASIKGSAISCGFTQIKYNDQIKDADVKEIFDTLGIKSEEDLYTPEKSAKATVALLSVFNRRMQRKAVQDGIKAANGVIIEQAGWEIKNGHAQKTYETKPWINQVTDEDALCYYWNQGARQLINGTADPEANAYTRNVRQYLEKYTVTEDKAERARIIQEAKRKDMIKNFKPIDNNGSIGSIVFMPKMYTNNQTNSETDLKILRTALAKSTKIDDNSKNLLLLSVQNGEIGFEFGLKEEEANNLTQCNVDLMLTQISNLKQELEEQNTGIDFSDGINSYEKILLRKQMASVRRAEFEFKKQYLASLSPEFLETEIPAKNLLETPLENSLDLSKSLTASRRGFAGKVTDSGINKTGTSCVSAALAEFAQAVALEMNSGGRCMTGFRRAMLNAGIETANNDDLVEGTPRATVGWFERHPDMFEEVRFIKTENGNARQINSTDLINLPAGYIVIWIPDDNYIEKGEPGHISITNGNGQAYADETDNLDWGVFHGRKNSGKGEHGTFRVFRLTDDWKLDENEKLKFCK